MHLARKHLPSPLMGQGSSGGGTRASSPTSPPSPARGEGVFPFPCQEGEGNGHRGRGAVLSQRKHILTPSTLQGGKTCKKDVLRNVSILIPASMLPMGEGWSERSRAA
jgi:hypothetical protein